jgi:hypothetical protein
MTLGRALERSDATISPIMRSQPGAARRCEKSMTYRLLIGDGALFATLGFLAAVIAGAL